MPDIHERRKYARFTVGEGAFAFIDNIPFTIRDISEGGMKLQSVVFDQSMPKEILLDIFLKNENFYLQNLPVRLVRFQKQNPSSPFSSAHIRCFGLQFGDLTEQQKTRLDHFIAHSSSAET